MRFVAGATVLLFCAFIGFSNGQAVQRSSFGNFCNETVKCDKGAWLTCQSSSCACLLDSMIYDHVKAKCVSKSGERCKFQLSDLSNDQRGLALFENTDCVANAHCANGFTCACASGFYESVNGSCLEQKEVNALCASSTECQHAKLLFCIDGQCRCSNESQHIWGKPNDSDSFKCVGKAGQLLTESATCIEGTKLQNGRCACVPEDKFFAEENGRCIEKRYRNSMCVKNEGCRFVDEFLSCVNGLCGCDPTNSVYYTFAKTRVVETESTQEQLVVSRYYKQPEGANTYYIDLTFSSTVRGKWLKSSAGNRNFGYILTNVTENVTDVLSQCVGLARHPCNPNSHCVKDSTCDARSICSCNAGFSPTSVGTCGIGHGQPCSKLTPCSDMFRCTNGKCDCPQVHHQVYHEQRQKCVGLVSSSCVDNSDCLDNSECRYNNKSSQRQCACASGFVQNLFGKCDKAWHSQCDYSTEGTVPCDTVAGLKCRNGQCACDDTRTIFNATLRRCVGLVGSRCGYLMSKTLCVHGAKCVQEVSNVPGQCECEENYKVNEVMTCDLKVSIGQTAPPIEFTSATTRPMTNDMMANELNKRIQQLKTLNAEMGHYLKNESSWNDTTPN